MLVMQPGQDRHPNDFAEPKEKSYDILISFAALVAKPEIGVIYISCVDKIFVRPLSKTKLLFVVNALRN